MKTLTLFLTNKLDNIDFVYDNFVYPSSVYGQQKTGCVERQRLLQYLLRAECGSQGERKYIVGMVNTHVDLLSFDSSIVSKQNICDIVLFLFLYS